MHKSILVGTLALISSNVKADDVTNYDNGIGGDAPCMNSYQGIWSSEGLEDVHGCHGIETQDRSIVVVGNGLEKEQSGAADNGFIVKTKDQRDCATTYESNTYPQLTEDGTDCNTFEWRTIISSTDGKRQKMNWVQESPDGTYLMVVGMVEQSDSSNQDIYVAKIASSDGSITWSMTYSTGSNNAGAETGGFMSDGGFVLGGFVDSSLTGSDLSFKSGGQVDDGTPFIGKISASDCSGTSAPTDFEWTYTNTDADLVGSAKSLRIDSSDNVNFINCMYSGCTVYQLSSTGSETWNTGTTFKAEDGDEVHIQMNDLTLVSDGLVIVGQEGTLSEEYGCSRSFGGGCGVIKGYMIKLDSSGNKVWEQNQFGNYPGGINQFWELEQGKDELVYNECWGIAPSYDDDLTTQNGFVIACGTGIEGCATGLSGQLWAECKTDPRVTWRSLTIATDLDGNRVWSRMDNFQSEEEDEVWSSANEYVISLAEGGHAIITDEAMGLGIGMIGQYNASTQASVTCPDPIFAEWLSAIKTAATVFTALSIMIGSL